MLRPLALTLFAVVAAGLPSGAAAQANCAVNHPLARAGNDVFNCVSTLGSTDIMLSGGGSIPNPVNGGIEQFCWTTDVGVFVESGATRACSGSSSVTLRLPNGAGATEAHVVLTATDFQGCSGQDSLVVRDESRPVILRALASTATACSTTPIELIAQAADTFSPTGLLTYEWDLNVDRDTDGNGSPDDDVDASAVGVSGATTVVSLTPLRIGTIRSRVRVRAEESDCVATAEITFEDIEPPKLGILVVPDRACPGTPATFHAELTGDSTPAEISWDFDAAVDADGDGDPGDDRQARGSDVAFTFTGAARPRILRVTATTPTGCTTFLERVVDVPAGVAAAFTTEGPSCGVLAVTFRDRSSGSGSLSVAFDFGDGAGFQGGSVRTHVFPSTGTYAVTETVLDSLGCQSTATRSIVVQPSALSLAGVRVLDGEAGSGTSGNGDGFLDPGERVRLVADVRNGGSSTASGVTLSGALLGIPIGATITQPSAPVAPIPAGGIASSLTPGVEITLADQVPCGTSIPVRFTISGDASGTCNSIADVALRVGRPRLLQQGDAVTLASAPEGISQPAVAGGGDVLAVAYTEVDGFPVHPRVRVLRVSPTGAAIGAPISVSDGFADETSPRIAWSGQTQRFAVTWLEQLGAQRSAWFRLLRIDGTPVGAPLRLDLLGTAGSVDVTWASGWIAAWTDAPFGLPATAAYAQGISDGGLPLGAVQAIGAAGIVVDHVRLAANGAAWIAALTEMSGVSLDVLSFPGGSLTPQSTLALGRVDDQPASLAPSGAGFLVAFATTSGVEVARVAGGVLSSRAVVGSGRLPSMAALPDFAAVSWISGSSIRARALTLAGAPFGSELVVAPAADANWAPSLGISQGGLLLATWIAAGGDLTAAALQPSASGDCSAGVPGDVAPSPNGDGDVDVADVVEALRISVGLDVPTSEQLARGDVAPGERVGTVHRAVGNGRIDIGDVVVLLEASTGLITLER